MAETAKKKREKAEIGSPNDIAARMRKVNELLQPLDDTAAARVLIAAVTVSGRPFIISPQARFTAPASGFGEAQVNPRIEKIGQTE